jgi:hypothetical protein
MVLKGFLVSIDYVQAVSDECKTFSIIMKNRYSSDKII